MLTIMLKALLMARVTHAVLDTLAPPPHTTIG